MCGRCRGPFIPDICAKFCGNGIWPRVVVRDPVYHHGTAVQVKRNRIGVAIVVDIDNRRAIARDRRGLFGVGLCAVVRIVTCPYREDHAAGHVGRHRRRGTHRPGSRSCTHIIIAGARDILQPVHQRVPHRLGGPLRRYSNVVRRHRSGISGIPSREGVTAAHCDSGPCGHVRSEFISDRIDVYSVCDEVNGICIACIVNRELHVAVGGNPSGGHYRGRCKSFDTGCRSGNQ